MSAFGTRPSLERQRVNGAMMTRLRSERSPSVIGSSIFGMWGDILGRDRRTTDWANLRDHKVVVFTIH
jgi:hypothetical protein